MVCPCGAYYVGKIRRKISQRVYDHTYAAAIGYYKSTIGKHFALQHNYKVEPITFIPLTHNLTIYVEKTGIKNY